MPPKIRKYWVLVADGGRARILEMGTQAGEFRVVKELQSPSRSQPTRELVSDASGRAFHSKGPAGHSKEKRSDAHDLMEEGFIRDIARRVQRAASAGSFDALVVSADPRTLGKLRKLLNGEAAKRIVRELNLDLTGVPTRELEAKIRQAL